MSYLITFLSLAVIDGVWLSTMSKLFYAKHLGFLMGPVVWPAVAIFYPLYAVGLTVFVVNPAMSGLWTNPKVFIMGALFGLVAYATYDLTNHATVRDWPLVVTIVDMCWGALMSGAVALIARAIMVRIG